MQTSKKLGVWMDHSTAHLMEFTSKHFEIETIESKETSQQKNIILNEDDSLIKSKEKNCFLIIIRKLEKS